jgi:hypothetical protein
MNYKELPPDQRIELASQYALLLVADNKPDREIISILKSDYGLTEEQATQAIGAMRSNYKNEYNSTLSSNLFKALGTLGGSLFVCLVYYLFGKEVDDTAGTIYFIFAGLAGLVGVAALIITGRIIGERFSGLLGPIRDAFTRPAAEQDTVDKILEGVAIMSFLFLCFLSGAHFLKSGAVNVKQVVTIDNCIIAKPVRYEFTRGKGARHWYAFKFMDHNLEFRFYDAYYTYSNNPGALDKLKVGDTVSIQLRDQKTFSLYQFPHNTGELDIINLGLHGRFLVDLDYRNVCYSKERKKFFHVLLAVFAGVMPVIFLKNQYYNKKPDRQTTR